MTAADTCPTLSNTVTTGKINDTLKRVVVQTGHALRIHSTRVGSAILAASALSDPDAINRLMGWKANSNQFRRYARLISVGQNHGAGYSAEELEELKAAKNPPILDCFDSLFPA